MLFNSETWLVIWKFKYFVHFDCMDTIATRGSSHFLLWNTKKIFWRIVSVSIHQKSMLLGPQSSANIFFYVPQKKKYTGLEQHEGEKVMTFSGVLVFMKCSDNSKLLKQCWNVLTLIHDLSSTMVCWQGRRVLFWETPVRNFKELS